MLSLDSPRWAELAHAYGSAADIPLWLSALASVPPSANDAEPWFSLWSALAHQGDVYDASFAAVPYVVQALASAPMQADSSYFHFPAWVEICRVRNGADIPSDLQTAYFEALSLIPALVADAATREWDEDFLACALAALAAAKGPASMAEAILELTPRVAQEFLEWSAER